MTTPIISKICTTCQTSKPISDFYKTKYIKDGFRSQCKQCVCASNRKSDKRTKEQKAIYATVWRQKNPRLQQMRVYARKYRHKHIYAITQEIYEQMLLAQDYKCKICDRQPAYGLVVDHCHKTGKVRGLLCKRCNSALGAFGDSLEGVMKAISYLSE